ncbi:MAG: ABC transporter permease, partial [Bacteroidetes bacterium]|nr:ABC transporter permease [Bacteroidota bacterium]
MFWFYLKAAFSNIRRERLYVILNIGGLAAGLLCALLIFLYVSDELSYDTYHKNHRNIYRINSDIQIAEKTDLAAFCPMTFGPAIKKEIAEVKDFVRFRRIGKRLCRARGREFYEENIFFADPSILTVFTHDFVEGNPVTAMQQPNSLLISESFSARYFGSANPIGQEIAMNNGFRLTVTGVFEDLPANIHLRYDAIIPISKYYEAYRITDSTEFESLGFWTLGFYTYLLLNDGVSSEFVEKAFTSKVYDKYMKDIGDQLQASYNIKLGSLASIHHSTGWSWDLPVSNKSVVYVFAFMAIFILIVACINYMNMSTARSQKRAIETGIRKVCGASRLQLFIQYEAEAVFFAFVSLLIALGLAELLMPYFNQLSGKNFEFNDLIVSWSFPLVIVITLITGLISGTYPAFYLSAFSPAVVLKNCLMKRRHGGILRKVLVVFQVLISVILLSGTLIIRDQMAYIQTKDIGIDKEKIIKIELRDSLAMAVA